MPATHQLPGSLNQHPVILIQSQPIQHFTNCTTRQLPETASLASRGAGPATQSNSVAAHALTATPHASQTLRLSYQTGAVPAQRTATTHRQLYQRQRQHTYICCTSASLVDQLHTHQRCTSGRHVHLPASQPAAVLFIRHQLRRIRTLEHTTNSIVITAEADAASS